MGLKYTQIDSQKPKESIDVRFISLGCIVFELSACENSAKFPAESGCKANDLTRYKVDTTRRVLPCNLIEVAVSYGVLRRPTASSVTPGRLRMLVRISLSINGGDVGRWQLWPCL